MYFVDLVNTLTNVGIVVYAVGFLAAVGLLIFDRKPSTAQDARRLHLKERKAA